MFSIGVQDVDKLDYIECPILFHSVRRASSGMSKNDHVKCAILVISCSVEFPSQFPTCAQYILLLCVYMCTTVIVSVTLVHLNIGFSRFCCSNYPIRSEQKRPEVEVTSVEGCCH